MTEILTESFCERCGTRYTFESARPRVRLKGVKVLSRGLRNFVLSDDTSIDEAMAAARSEAEREATGHQLDAFHKTFNFCLSCRQYTCPNCWNGAEARCLSCAPLAMADAPTVSGGFRVLREAVVEVEPTAGDRTADHEHIPWQAPTTPPSAPWIVEAPAETEDVPSTTARLADVEIEPTAGDAEGMSPAAREAADKAATQTSDLLERFRPGQSLDAELDAYERERSDPGAIFDGAAEPELVAAESEAAVAAEPDAGVAAQPDPATVEIAAADGPDVMEFAGAEAQAALVAEASASVEPIAPVELAPIELAPIELAPDIEAPPEPALQSLAGGAGSDVVEQPTWQITAPDETGTVPRTSAPTDLPTSEPHWPASSQRPGEAAAGLPFLGRPATPEGGIEALWAASNQELVAAPPAPGRATSGIRPCVSCGLSLSANARFCRRCGTLQGG